MTPFKEAVLLCASFSSETFGCAERVNILIARLSARKETSVARRRNLTVFSVQNSQMLASAEGKGLEPKVTVRLGNFSKILSSEEKNANFKQKR